MTTFKELVAAIKENNDINEGHWSDWESSKHIQNIYGELEQNEYTSMYEAFLNEMIQNEAENLEKYLDVLDCLNYGQVMHRSN